MTSGGKGRVQEDGTTREIYGKIAVWMGRSKVQGRISKQIGKKLEEVEGGQTDQ